MSIATFLHSVATKLDPTAKLPPVAPLPEKQETTAKVYAAINGASSPIPQEITMATLPINPAPTQHNAFVGFLISVGKFFEKGLGFAVQYAPAAAGLASLLIPGSAGTAATAVTAIDLIQKAVISVEQKYAASGIQNGTGTAKSAEVLTLTSTAVTELLTQAGVKDVTTDYIQSLVTAVVGILNAHSALTA